MNQQQFDRILAGLNPTERQVLHELLNNREIATTVASNKSDVQKIRRGIYHSFGIKKDDGRRRGRFFLVALFFKYKPELVNIPYLKNFQSMSAEDFEEICDRLSTQEKPVLQLFLQNQTDEEIATSLNKNPGTIRKQIRNIYHKFGIRGNSTTQRNYLIPIFFKYKPELLNIPPLTNLVGAGFGSHSQVGAGFGSHSDVGAGFGSHSDVGAGFGSHSDVGAGFGSHSDVGAGFKPAPTEPAPRSPKTNKQHWGEAPDVSIFHGRNDELDTLQTWITQDRCRVLVLLGIGGIGKTALSVKLAQEVAGDFEAIIWRSLREAPPLSEMLDEINQLFNYEPDNPEDVPIHRRITQLIDHLKEHRCLMVFDNVEAILQPQTTAGRYRPGYEDYGDFLTRLGETEHQGCLMLTSREKPKAINALQGPKLPVRVWKVQGLDEGAIAEILKAKGLDASATVNQQLTDSCNGNPLVLKLIATRIQELYGGSAANYLNRGEAIAIQDVCEVLDQQWQRLSLPEQHILYWLAINREPVTPETLQEDMMGQPLQPDRRQLIEILYSLVGRSLVESISSSLTPITTTLQNVVMEYLTNRFIQEICTELQTGNLNLFNSHALIKATAKDYVRESQIRLILQPIADYLTNLIDLQNPRPWIEQFLHKLRVGAGFKPAPTNPKFLGYAAGNLINLLCQLKINLSHTNFSQLPIRQAYLKGHNLNHTDFSQCHFVGSVFTDVFGPVFCLAVSPKERLVAIGDGYGAIRLWGFDDSQPFLTIQGHQGWVRSIAFSPDGNLLASGSADKTVKLWDLSNGDCIATLTEHQETVRSVVFSADSQNLATGAADRLVKLWSLSHPEQPQCLHTFTGHTEGVCCVALSQESDLIASSSNDMTIRLWDRETGEVKVLEGHENWVWSVAFSPHGHLLASSSDDRTVKLWDVDTGDCLQTLHRHQNGVHSVAFSPDGNLLASGSDDKTIVIWDVGTGELLHVLYGHTNWIWQVAFNPHDGGKTLASSSVNNFVKLWDVRTGKCQKSWQGYTNWIWGVALSPDGQLLASGSLDRMVRLWCVKTGECLKTLAGHLATVQSVDFSPDGQLLASSSGDRMVKLWEVSTGRLLRTFTGHEDAIWCVRFSPDGKLLATGSGDETARVWNTHTGECLYTFEEHTRPTRTVAFSGNGEVLATGSDDLTVRLWNLQTGECLSILTGHQDWVGSLAASSQGSIVASGSDDTTVRLWNWETGDCLQTLPAHHHWVHALAMSQDGAILASGSSDRTIKIWNPNTGNCLHTLTGHNEGVRSLSLSANATTLASGSEDETIKLWDVNQGALMNTLRVARPYAEMKIAEIEGLTPAAISTLQANGAME
ncbi:NB-ARC domain-containing protein [Roseofilum sp. BLCC_M91]|uniref:NB-ARC domain-containing protein n=1 Tax=Roseofilum halophilum BLCC-M91 TaxID=3022259 RepID=A0ABT7BGK9_9CYAN|nr:NB-ARC domain-containing protein [Roseofilum halophilum]MDJ1178301.1 NB-ARC domain-containing protein [Roseofilum halophilum BLCC-M91]